MLFMKEFYDGKVISMLQELDDRMPRVIIDI